MHFCQAGAYGFNHFFADKPQTDDQSDTESQHGNRRHSVLSSNAVGTQHIHNRGKRTNRIGNIVRTMAECKTASGKYLHP